MTTPGGLPMQLWLNYWRYRRFYHRYSVEGLEHLDGAQPALIVGYHGRGLAYDLCMLTVTLYERLGYLPRTLVHRGVDSIPPLKWLSDGLGFVTGDGGAIGAAIADGQHIITAPGGATEACRSFRDRYRVAWGDHVGYLRLALKYGLRIVPVGASGVDDTYIGLNAGPALGRWLGLPADWAWALWVGVGPLGVWPISPPFPSRIHQVIGEPIDLGANGSVRVDDRAALLRLHRQITGRVQDLLDRARGVTPRVPASLRSVVSNKAFTQPRFPEDRERRPPMPKLKDILLDEDIATLREGYDRDGMNKQLRDTFSTLYASTTGYIGAISDVFYELPEDIRQQPNDKLSPANRERCLIALLTARGGGFTLATHIYLALMEGFKDAVKPQDDISVEEIAHMIFLAGVYSGADNLALSLVTLVKTLKILKQHAVEGTDEACSQEAIFKRLKAEFNMSPEPSQSRPPLSSEPSQSKPPLTIGTRV